MAISEVSKEAVWLWKFLIELGVVPYIDKSLIMYCENFEEVSQCKEPRNHENGSTWKGNTT
jgi:hypothetical protein